VCVSVCVCLGQRGESSGWRLATGTKQVQVVVRYSSLVLIVTFDIFPLKILGKSVGNSCEMFSFKKRKSLFTVQVQPNFTQGKRETDC